MRREWTRTLERWPRSRPNTVEDVRSFLGLARYYREHVQNYADIAAPLHALTKKGILWQWTEEAEEAYQGLVAALTSETLLAHLRLDEGGWVVDTDSSGWALGAVLSQVQDGQEMVIRYASKCLSLEHDGTVPPRGWLDMALHGYCTRTMGCAS